MRRYFMTDAAASTSTSRAPTSPADGSRASIPNRSTVRMRQNTIRTLGQCAIVHSMRPESHPSPGICAAKPLQGAHQPPLRLRRLLSVRVGKSKDAFSVKTFTRRGFRAS